MAVRDGINIDSQIWGPDATQFRPERWLEEGALSGEVQKIHAQGHVLTFGDGCVMVLGFYTTTFSTNLYLYISSIHVDLRRVWDDSSVRILITFP